MSESLGKAFGCAFMGALKGALKGALTCWFLPFWLTWSKLWVVVPNKCKSPTKPMVSRGYLILGGWVSINSPKGIVFFMALWQIAWRLLQMEWIPMLVRTIKNVNHLSTPGLFKWVPCSKLSSPGPNFLPIPSKVWSRCQVPHHPHQHPNNGGSSVFLTGVLTPIHSGMTIPLIQIYIFCMVTVCIIHRLTMAHN